MKLTKILSAVCTSLIFIGGITPAQATSTDVVLNLEGNPTCSSLGANSEVLEYRDNSPTGGTVVLPTKEGGTQTLTYTVGTTVVEGKNKAVVDFWELTDFSNVENPINYTILKAQGGGSNGGARVFHFGAAEDGDGAITDTDEIATGSNLAAVSFCYGLTAGFDIVEPPLPAPVPSCEDLVTSSETLDGTGISCEVGGEQRLLINMELNATNFGFDDAFHACTCNVTEDVGGNPMPTGLPECNPELAAVEKGSQDENTPPEERSCMEYDITDANNDGIPDAGVNTQVPVLIQGVENPDSYICYTINGVRTCYGHY